MSNETSCVFCRITAGQLPALIVYEDEAIVSFLDVNPLADGHLLVVPRIHFETLVDLPADVGRRVAEVLPRLGKALLEVTGAAGFNVLQNNGREAGQVVPHVHFHLIPRTEGDGLGYRWNAGRYGPGRDAELLAAYQNALRPATG